MKACGGRGSKGARTL